LIWHSSLRDAFSLQNSSDPNAIYSGHKGQGYQVQVMEAYCDDEEEMDRSLNHITQVDVEAAHKSNVSTAIPAIELVEETEQ